MQKYMDTVAEPWNHGAMAQEIIHDTEKHRFVIIVDGQEAGFAAYVPTAVGTVRDFNHTVIDPEFRGKGLSSPLVQAALDECRAAGFTIIPTCSAVQHFIAKNPGYADLVEEES